MIYQDLKEVIEQEGNKKDFEYKGYRCHIIRVGIPYSGHLCGYIEIPEGHELYKMDYDEIEDKYQGLLPAHGGLTFSDFVDNKYWIGFDCLHCGDLQPMYAKGFERFRRENDTYKNMEYVTKNIKEIVDFIELKKALNGGNR